MRQALAETREFVRLGLGFYKILVEIRSSLVESCNVVEILASPLVQIAAPG